MRSHHWTYVSSTCLPPASASGRPFRKPMASAQSLTRGQVQRLDVVNSNTEFTESLKYLPKRYIRGGVRATENRHVSGAVSANVRKPQPPPSPKSGPAIFPLSRA